MKKIFSAAVAVCMICAALLAFPVFAEETAELPTSGKVGSTEISWSFDAQSGRLELSGKGALLIEGDTAPWDAFPDRVHSLVVGDGITEIDSFAFDNMSALSAITLPYSIEYIGENAFYNTYYYNHPDNQKNGVLYIGNCLIKAENDAKKSYAVKDGTRVIAAYAFEGCDSLSSVTLPEGVTHINTGAFNGCESLKRITLPSTLAKVGNGAFADCTALEKVTYRADKDSYAKVFIGYHNDDLRSADTVFDPIPDETTADPSVTTKAPGSLPSLAGCSAVGLPLLFAAVAAAVCIAVVTVNKR